MADPNNPNDKPEDKSTSSVLASELKTPLHEQVFGSDPDGSNHETPRGAIGKNVVFGGTAVQPSGHGPMTGVGDTDHHH